MSKKECNRNDHVYVVHHGVAVCTNCDHYMDMNAMVTRMKELKEQRDRLLFTLSHIREWAKDGSRGVFTKKRVSDEIETMMNPDKYGIKFRTAKRLRHGM